MHNITDLVQVAQQAHHEYMGWHDGEHRLLTCISRPHIEELKQEIQRGRELRRAAIAEGKTAGKEYRQLSAHISSLESELADMEVIAAELEDGAFERSCSGQELWGQHLKQRVNLANTYLDGLIASDQDEAREALVPLLPLLARLVSRGRQKAAISSFLQDDTSTVFTPSSLIEPAEILPLDMVKSLVAELLEPIWRDTDPELDPVVMEEIKRIPPSNLIRLDLVGSPAAKNSARTKQALRMEQTEEPKSAVQASRDNWSPDAMLTRSKNLREA
ncbi:hypothetical protein WH06_22010 [Aeromonas salmonicida subsp. salmonicida]|uniref:Uncharacterized protein n=2 Tax=Aeromonas salmonicida subsp. salmonicida TaxID=29491 RepID=A4SRV7_AERS4|nr:hypothetical protein [Aeromonas salmonicida]ABO91629.1 hypothetical protein ASA_3668 [Aeromonas salmonicida subsp. salmonicida A449]AYO64620.1 hypothetical protein C5P03_18745 [Aeromonas salmonicida subsp. salmonicida 01-B526]EHI50484.1 hypothetical protein IYQ_21208 [Aeromonas salmonicida subsp. salmonicida 01-B526]EKP0240358.1 hypothetical protein [Aeromonas salmonicida]EKP0244540.1 hypothetical protein [Aeromonas salmonicida]